MQGCVTAQRVVGGARHEQVLPVGQRAVGTLRIVDLVDRPAREHDHLQNRRQHCRFGRRAQLLPGHDRERIGTMRQRKRQRRCGRVRFVATVRIGEQQPLPTRHPRTLRAGPRLADPTVRQRFTCDNPQGRESPRSRSRMTAVSSTDPSSTTITLTSSPAARANARTPRRCVPHRGPERRSRATARSAARQPRNPSHPASTRFERTA